MSVSSRLAVAVETAAVGIAFTALLLGVTVGLVAAPGVTAALVRANRTWVYTGLTPARTVELADGVRSWVTNYPAEETAAGRRAMQAFAADEVSHLDDVRAVMNAAKLATGICAALLAAWLVACLVFRRWMQLRRGFAAGGIAAVAFVALVAAASLVDFSSAFSAFHGLFFRAGTWEFSADSLLIRTFPGSFWMSAGALWGALVALGGLLLFGASRLLPRDDEEAQRGSDRGKRVADQGTGAAAKATAGGPGTGQSADVHPS